MKMDSNLHSEESPEKSRLAASNNLGCQNYSDEQLQRVQKQHPNFQFWTVKSETSLSLKWPEIIDDRQSMNNLVPSDARALYKGLTVQGPFAVDDSTRFICCQLAWQGVDGLILIDLEKTEVIEIGQLTGKSRKAIKAIEFQGGRFKVLVGEVHTGDENKTTAESDSDLLWIHIDNPPDFIITDSLDKQPKPCEVTEPEFYRGFLIIRSYGAELTITLNDSTVAAIEGSSEVPLDFRRGDNNLGINCSPNSSSYGFNIEVIIKKQDNSLAVVEKISATRPEQKVDSSFTVSFPRQSL